MDYDALVILAALTSVHLARELSSDQLELLSAFFEALGDDLALLALRTSSCKDTDNPPPPGI